MLQSAADDLRQALAGLEDLVAEAQRRVDADPHDIAAQQLERRLLRAEADLASAACAIGALTDELKAVLLLVEQARPGLVRS